MGLKKRSKLSRKKRKDKKLKKPSLGKITSIEGARPQSKFESDLMDFRRNILGMIEYNVLQAQVARAKYDALLSEGFTEKQALELCK